MFSFVIHIIMYMHVHNCYNHFCIGTKQVINDNITTIDKINKLYTYHECAYYNMYNNYNV